GAPPRRRAHHGGGDDPARPRGRLRSDLLDRARRRFAQGHVPQAGFPRRARLRRVAAPAALIVCWSVHIASDVELPLVPWVEAAPGFHVELPDPEAGGKL